MSRTFILWIGLGLIGAGCGKLGSSASSKSTDAFPTGASVRAQGDLQSFNDSSIEGSASVLQGTDGKFILRLESFSGPKSLSGLKIALVAAGTDAFIGSLKATRGNQNYSTSIEAAQVWSSVEIRDARKTAPNDVQARALLLSTAPPLLPSTTGE